MASVITNIVETVYRARGGQMMQESRLVAQGVGGIGRQINEASNMSERFNRQWKAIGTTMRYAIAGGVVFGLTRMVGQLKDVQQQLGLMQAIGSPGGQPFSNAGINQLGNSLQRSAVQALTPINEINDATINLLSTVQNVPESDIPNIITNIGQAAKLSQTPIEDLTKAATTMNIAFGRANNASTIRQFNRQWFSLIQEAPGGVSAAPEIANQLAPLASMFALGQGPVSGAQSQSQMMSLVLGSLRTGATPSTGLRGLTYLLQSIIQPTGKARGALSAIGITPQSIENEGVYANLMRLLQHVTNPGRGNLRRISHMDDTTLENMGDTGNLPGIPASEMANLRTMIPRIHGIRTAVILAGQLQGSGQRKSLDQDLTLMAQARQDHADDVHSMARAWKAFNDRSPLQGAMVAIGALRLQVAQAFEPLLNYVARGTIGGVGALQHHRTAVRNVALGGAGVIAALGAGRFLGLIGRNAGSTIARSEAIRDFSHTGLGASPNSPMYVIVVGQLFNPRQAQIPGGGTQSIEEKAVKTGLRGWLGVKAAQALAARGVGRLAAGVAGGVGVAELPAAGDAWNWLRHGVDPTTGQRINNPWWQRALGAGGDFNSAQQYHQVLQRANRMFGPGVTNIERFHRGKENGVAEIYMTLDLKHPDGSTETRRVKIPAKLWQNGSYPMSRGKAGARHG